MTTSGEALTTAASAEPAALSVAPTPEAPAPVGFINRVITTLLAPFTPTSATPATAQTPVLWGVFAWVRRTFFNSTPTLTYDPTTTTQVDDTITGRLTAADADGDTLALTASTPVNGGTVVVNSDGTFTYTAPESMYNTGGTDTFTVTAVDTSAYWHMHGFSGFLNAITFGWLGDDGHDVTTTVNVTVAPVNSAPIPGTPAYTLGAAEPSTGAVAGEMHVTDPDLDTLTYLVAGGPADGNVILNPLDGTFTYTPTPAARHEASAENATPDQLADNFNVSVDDGHGGVTSVPVAVSIDPTNVPPNMTLVVSDPNAEGAVNVSVTVTDPDTDPVTYIVVQNPAFGTLTATAGGYTYTPSAEARHTAAATPGIDTDTFQLRASDLHHGIDTETATVTISPDNIAPSGLTQTVNIPDPVTGIVTGTITGTDADGDPLTFTGTATTPEGTVIVDPDGTFAYTPTPEACHAAASDTATPDEKSDTFDITADDGHGGTAVLAVTVPISPVNTAPTGAATPGAPNPVTGVVTGTITGADTDGDPLTYGGTATTPKGAVTVDPAGTFIYTPTPDARHAAAAEDATPDQNADTFNVTINDAHGGLTSVAVTVTVSPANSAPTGTADVDAPNPDTGAVTGTITASDLDNDALTFSGSASTPKGAVVVNSDGSFTYTPTPEARHTAAADTATPDQKADAFSVTVTDGHGGTTAVPVTVTISPSNSAPTGTTTVNPPDPAFGVVIGAVTGTDTDGDALTFSGTATTAKGSVVVNTDGTFGYTPNPVARHAAAADGATDADKQDTFDITIADGHGGLTTVPVTVAISPANIAPSGTANPGSPDPATGVVTGTVTGADTDGDTLTYTGSTTTAKGTVDVNTDGSFTYTPNSVARHAAAADDATDADKQDTFTVTIADAHGGTTTVPVTVTISPANAGPTLQTTISDPNPDTGVVTGSVTGTDPDGDPLTYTGTATTPKGSVVVNTDGIFTYTPDPDARHTAAADDATPADKQDTFTITVTDGHGFTTVETVFVAVDPDNTAPSGTATPGAPDPATGVVTGTTIGTDPEGDPLTYSGSTTTSKGEVVVNADGTFTYTPTDEARHTAAADNATEADKLDSFDISVNDAHGGVTAVPVTVSIGSANAEPTLHVNVPDPDSATGVVAGSVTGTDPDGDTVTTTLTGASVKGSVTVDPDGTFTYTPTDEARHAAAADTASPADKLDTFIVTVNDGYGFSTPVIIFVSVSPSNTAPSGAYTSGDPDPATGAVTGTVTGSDADDDMLSYTGTATTPKGSVVVNPDGTFDYTPTPVARHAAAADGATDADKQDTFDVIVNDGHGATTPVSVTVTVGSANAAPTVNPSVAQPDLTSGLVSGSMNVADSDGDTVTYTVTATPGKGSVTVNPDGTFEYSPTPEARHVAAADGATDADKQDTFTVTVNDAHGGVVTVPVSVAVGPANAAPAGVPTFGQPGTDGLVSGSLNVTDTDGDTLIHTLTGDAAHGAVVVNPDGTFTYAPQNSARLNAANTAGVDTDSFTVTVSDGHGGTTDIIVAAVPVAPADAVVTATIPGFTNPQQVAVSPDGTHAYVTNYWGNSVSVIDTATNTVTATIPVGQRPHLVTVSPDGTHAYVTNYWGNSVSVIDTATNTVTATIPGFDGPIGVAVSPDGSQTYVTSRNNTVAVIDTATNTVTAIIPVGSNPQQVAVTPDGTNAYVANTNAGTVSVIDTTTNTVTATIPGFTTPYGVAVSPDGAYAYVTDYTSNIVSVIDTATNTVTATIPIGDYPYGVAVSPDGSLVYVANLSSNTVSVIDTATNTVIDTVPGFNSPAGLAVSPDGTYAYVTNVTTNTVSVLSLVPAAPDASTTVSTPDPATGDVTVTLTASDPEGDPLTVTNTAPSKGSVEGVDNLDGTWTYTYTPTDDARHDAAADAATPTDKQDTFTISVTDVLGGTAVLPVLVSISPLNLAPVGGTSASGTPDPVTGKVTGTISGVTDPDGDSLTYTGATTAKGSVTVSPDGTFTYTPTPEARHTAAADTAGPEDMTDSLTVAVGDGHGGSIGVPVSVDISPANVAPAGVTANPGTPDPTTGVVTGSVTATDPDNDPLTFTGTTTTAKGSVVVNADGSFTYTPTDAARHLAAADTASAADKLDEFTVTVDDGHGGTVSVIVGVDISPANTAPAASHTVTAPDPDTGVVTGSVTGTDPDNDTLSYTGTGATAKGNLIVNADGSFTYTPTDDARHDAAADTATDAEKLDEFTVTVDDGHGGATAVPISVTIDPDNALPAADHTVNAPDPATGVVTGTVTATDPDNDTLSYTGTTTTAKGSITVNTDGSFTYTPSADARHLAADENASATDKLDTFTITVDDAHGGTATVPITVTITPANTAPTIAPTNTDPDVLTGLVTGSLNGADTDNDTITYTLNTGPAKGTVTVNPDGSFSYDPTDLARLQANLTPEADTDTFTVTVDDGHGGASQVDVAVPVGAGQATVTDTIPVGSGSGSVMNSGDVIYVGAGNSVSVIDSTTNTVIDTISVSNPSGLAVSGDRLYVSNWSSSTVTVIDTTTNDVVTTIPMGGNWYRPMSSAVSGDHLYVANYGNPSWEPGSTVTVVDLATNTVVTRISTGSYPYGVAASGDHVYVTNSGSGTVSVIDTATNTVTNTITVGSRPMGATVHGDRLYITNFNSNTVTVIDTTTNAVVGDPIPVGRQPYAIAFSPDGSLAYVANYGDGTVTVIDPTTNVVVDADATTAGVNPIHVGGAPAGVAFSPNGSAYLSDSVGTNVSVVTIEQNGPPVASDPAYTIDTVHADTGIVDGAVHVTDPNNDTLTYSAPATTGKGGSVTVTPTGSFTYTPTAEARHAASADGASEADRQDSFTVTVDDGRGGTVAVPVVVTISPVNADPVSSGPTVGNPNGAGVVAGSLNVTDIEADALTYHLSTAPTFGRVTIDPLTGAYTYTPYTNARLIAYTTPAQEADTFTVTVTDGHGGSTEVSVVAVPVSPADAVLTESVATGSGSYGVAVNPAGTRAYVVNQVSGSVSVVDTATDTVTATIPVGVGPRGVAVTPDGSYAYVTNYGSHTVSVIDTALNSVAATIAVGGNPQGVAISPDGTRAFVVNSQSGSVTVINTADNTVVTTIAVDPYGGGDPIGVAVSPDGTRAYVTRAEKNNVAVIDTATNTVIATIPGMAWPHGVAVSPDGTRAYVANTSSYSVSVIDTGTNSVIATVPVAGRPSQVAVSPDGTIVYVSPLDGSNSVSLIDTATNTVVDTVAFPAGARLPGVATSPDGIHAYVTNNTSGTVSVISIGHNDAPVVADPAYTVETAQPHTGIVGGVLHVTDPDGDLLSYAVTAAPTQGTVTVNPDGSFSYDPTDAARLHAGPTDTDGFTVTVSDGYGASTPVTVTGIPITPAQFADIADIPVGNNPFTTAVSPDGARAYVTNFDSNTVSVVDTARNTVIATIPVGTGPLGVAVTPNGTRAYVANSGSSTVTVIDTATNGTSTINLGPAGGGSPWAVAISPDGTRVYVTNPGSGLVSVIDTATNTVIDTNPGMGGVQSIYVAGQPRSIALSPDGTRAYVGNVSNNKVSVINTATYAVTDTINVVAPYGVAVSPDGTRAYVTANYNSVSVINTANNSVIATIDVGSSPNAVTVSPDGSLAYVTKPSSGTVAVIDATSNAVTNTIAVGSSPNAVTVSPDGGRLYVTHSGTRPVSVISLAGNTAPVAADPASTVDNVNTATGIVNGSMNVSDADDDTLSYAVTTAPTDGKVTFGPNGSFTYDPNDAARLHAQETPGTDADGFTVTATDGYGGATPVTVTGLPISPAEATVKAAASVGSSPTVVTVSPDGARAYVANPGGGTVSVVNTATNGVIHTITVGGNPNGLALSPDGTRLYVPNTTNGTLSVYDTSSYNRVGVVGGMYNPAAIAVNPAGTRAYVANWGTNLVSVVNTTNNTLVTNISLNAYVGGLAVSPDGTRVYVANNNANSVSVIDTATNTVIGTPIPVGYSPYDVAFSPDGTRAYVLNSNGNSVSVIDTATRVVTATITVGSPQGLTLSPDGSLLYVSRRGGSNSVTVIDTATNSAIGGPIPVGNSPADMAVSPDGSRIYVTNSASNSVSVIHLVGNSAPVAGSPAYSIDGVNSTTGAVMGSVHATDPDGDTLGYSAVVPAEGQLVFDQAGHFTFIPSDALRLRAGVTPETDTMTFTINVTDSHNATTAVPINVQLLPATATVTDTISVSPLPVTVALRPGSTTGYVVIGSNNTLAVIDTTSNQVVTYIPVGINPFGVAVSPNGTRAYVTNSGSNTVTVIDTKTNGTTSFYTGGASPYAVAFSPDSSHAYVTNSGSNTVSIINTANNAVEGTVLVAPNPKGIAISPDGTRAYVASQIGVVSVIDIGSRAVTPISGFDAPVGVTLSPDGAFAYIVNSGDGTVSVIDTTDNSIITNIPTGGVNPQLAAIGGDGSLLYVVNNGSGTVSVIDTFNYAVITTIPVGNLPVGVTVSADGDHVYVANSNGSTVSVISVAPSGL
ncbi:Ig-like domain-containing protein [Mycobacterium sp. B14F4]|uniref:Ig-like domain-containing protein n=1 Tax=Mycobacterium sp. B14F4 TaxID=3153565 RepID=UPI00325E32CC